MRKAPLPRRNVCRTLFGCIRYGPAVFFAKARHGVCKIRKEAFAQAGATVIKMRNDSEHPAILSGFPEEAQQHRPSLPPYLRQGDTPRTFLWDTLIAVLPLFLFAVYLNGARVLTVAFLCVLFCVGTEAAMEWLLRRRVTVTDGRAVMTGLVLALLLPASVPLWMPAVGSIFAIAAVKEPFGGTGKSIVNPAFCGYAFLWVIGGEALSALPKPFVRLSAFAFLPDASALTQDTVLTVLKSGRLPDTSLLEVFLGNKPGSAGAGSALILAAVFLYLALRRTVKPVVPLSFLAASGVFCLVFPHLQLASDAIVLKYAAYQLCAGTLLFAAVFSGLEPETLPRTLPGQLAFGVGCGVLTMLLRYFTPEPDGAVFAVLVMNLTTPLLDHLCRTGGRGT